MKTPLLRFRLFAALFLSLGLLFTNCQSKKSVTHLKVPSSSSTSDSLESKTLTLELLKSGSLKFAPSKGQSDQITIEFTKVLNESRCPKDVNCIWAGNVEVAVNLEVNDSKSSWRLMSIGAQSSPELDFEGYRFTLEEVNPYPQANKTLEKGPYSVKIKVSPASTTNPPAKDPEKPNAN